MSRVVTGIRPTGDLSIANYVGAMKPITELQQTFEGPVNLFVADLHGLTDQEPDIVNSTRLDTVRSFLAAGVDPDKVEIYLQSRIEEPTVVLANYLDRHTSLAELLRNPTLKDKLKKDQRAESITVALGRYPILMAADIFVQDATDVPVGEDQYPHIEFARKLARRFNVQYGDGKTIIVEPEILATKSLRIMALNGDGKMSKSNPKGAIFLKDSLEEVKAKVNRAQTAVAGEMPTVLESHFTLCEELCNDEDQRGRLEDIKMAHLDGSNVMGDFKKFMTERLMDFLDEFQARYRQIDEEQVHVILTEGGDRAQEQASSVLERVRDAMGLVY